MVCVRKCCSVGVVAAALLLHELSCARADGPFLIDNAAPLSLAKLSVGTVGGRRIPSTFMGLSHEWGDTMSMFGYSRVGVNRIYRQLLINLTAYGSAPVDIRVGGDSTDLTGEPSGDRIKPMAELANALHVPFSLGVNLGANNVELAADQTRFYLAQMPPGSVAAIEIGNEPDLYPKRGTRPHDYSIHDYFSDFDRWKQAIQPLLPPETKLLGASWASPAVMQSNVAAFEKSEASALNAFSAHLYAGSSIEKPFDFLLIPSTASSGPRAVAAAVATTHAYGIPFRMGEINSLFGKGIHGISDAFGAALWAVDTMFEYANVGVDGVNWESSTGNYYAPFSFTRQTSGPTTTYSLQSVAPLYYGLLFFQATTAHNARLAPVCLHTDANLKAWATVDASGVTRVAIINKDKLLHGNVTVSVPGGRRGSVFRLMAPSYTSFTGITFAGQTFDGSPDGRLQGAHTIETIRAVKGVFEVSMPVTSAALLVIDKIDRRKAAGVAKRDTPSPLSFSHNCSRQHGTDIAQSTK